MLRLDPIAFMLARRRPSVSTPFDVRRVQSGSRISTATAKTWALPRMV